MFQLTYKSRFKSSMSKNEIIEIGKSHLAKPSGIKKIFISANGFNPYDKRNGLSGEASENGLLYKMSPPFTHNMNLHAHIGVEGDTATGSFIELKMELSGMWKFALCMVSIMGPLMCIHGMTVDHYTITINEVERVIQGRAYWIVAMGALFPLIFWCIAVFSLPYYNKRVKAFITREFVASESDL